MEVYRPVGLPAGCLFGALVQRRERKGKVFVENRRHRSSSFGSGVAVVEVVGCSQRLELLRQDLGPLRRRIW